MQFSFFLIFVVAVLICGAIKIGPLSIRVYMTVIMLAYLIVNNRSLLEKRYRIRRDYIRIFLVCIGALGLALLVNGYVFEFAFFEKCLAYYLVCIVTYFAADLFVKDEGHFNKLIFVIALIILLDDVASILQFQNNAIGWVIASLFSDLDTLNEFSGYFDTHKSIVGGISKIPGICSHPVTNGFFLSVTIPLLLTGIGKGRSKLIAILYIVILMISLVTLFLLQQRAPFFLVLMVVVYHLLRITVRHPSHYLLPFAAIIIIAQIIYYNSFNVDVNDLWGGLVDTDNSVREGNWRIAFIVIFDNLIFGNPELYNKMTDLSAHNVLIDSLINSGLFGFIPILYLFLKTVWDSSHIMLKSTNNYSRVFSYSVLICMAMGLVHNTSYLTGEVIIFLSLALMFKAQMITQKNKHY